MPWHAKTAELQNRPDYKQEKNGEFNKPQYLITCSAIGHKSNKQTAKTRGNTSYYLVSTVHPVITAHRFPQKITQRESSAALAASSHILTCSFTDYF